VVERIAEPIDVVKKRGVKRKFVVTPKIEDPSVFSLIMAKFDADLSGVDLNNVSEVHDRWLVFLDNLMEAECQKDE